MADVAAAAGVAKGAVYLYFTSQAHIFPALLLEGWSDVLARLAHATDETTAADPSCIVSALAHALRNRPDLLRLDAYGAAVLERQADAATLRAFESELVRRITETAGAIERALGLKRHGAERLLINPYAFTCGLWQTAAGQSAAPSPAPAFDVLYPDFWTEVERALLAYWCGELADLIERFIPPETSIR